MKFLIRRYRNWIYHNQSLVNWGIEKTGEIIIWRERLKLELEGNWKLMSTAPITVGIIINRK